MVKFVIKFKRKVLQEREIDQDLEIGRESGDIKLKNPAVSASHARLTIKDNCYILHDLGSTNGTFVNKGRIASQELHHGDVVTIGKFRLEFINTEEKSNDGFSNENGAGMTVMINTEEMLKEEKESKGKKTRKGRLRLMGKSGSSPGRLVEFKLKKDTTLIGSADNADIHLKGFMIGDVAASIHCSDGKYSIKFIGGFSKLKINNKKLSGEKVLKIKDKIEIGSYIFEFIA